MSMLEWIRIGHKNSNSPFRKQANGVCHGRKTFLLHRELLQDATYGCGWELSVNFQYFLCTAFAREGGERGMLKLAEN